MGSPTKTAWDRKKLLIRKFLGHNLSNAFTAQQGGQQVALLENRQLVKKEESGDDSEDGRAKIVVINWNGLSAKKFGGVWCCLAV